MDAPSEVGDLELSVQADHDVFWFDVSVDYVLTVAVVDCIAHLDDVLGSGLLVETSSVSEDLEKLTTSCVFEDEVDSGVVVEVSVHSDDVWMPELGLDLNLTAELVLNGGFLELGLVENLETDDELRLLLPCKVDASKLSGSEWSTNLEVVKAPLL